MIPLVIVFFILLAINMPIGFTIGISGAVFFLTNDIIPFSITVQRVVAQTQSIAFLAVPFFIFAGNLMNKTGITSRLLRFSSLLTRRMSGGLAQVNVVLSTMMGGVSGSAVADASMQARILGPDMIKKGYPRGYTAGITCLSSLITATIPPSLGLILYGFVGEVSIGKLFVAGIIPGFMMMVFLMTTVSITSRIHKYDMPDLSVEKITIKEILLDLKDSIWALMFPVILIVGIRFGLFTPSEAGAFAVVYALIIGKFVYKELTWKKFQEALKDSFIDNGAIILIIALSGIFGYALSLENVPGMLGTALVGITTNPHMMLIIIVLFLAVAGMFIDSNVSVLLLTPIFLPVIKTMGVDPVHFGILMMTIVTMGCMTPPVGTALYTVCQILDAPLEDFIKETMPFYLAVVLLVIVLIFIPDVVMFLPNLIY
ncbi:TRAP transporter large permease [Oceanispirochaeta crateris]|uniref:TRAP transporter large permease n=1 Tax=Oceanispirochaeta crateris TaxID=2518645 RepID=A0A5C1QSL5_9SPIO|nr:TRAP transporter large permease [Oceanispirochaeta crateris]QEN09586.1 TRAP transporter large permease [Oceanispirochaeta crateris]